MAFFIAVVRKQIPNAAGTYGLSNIRSNPAYRYPYDWWNHIPTAADGIPDVEAVKSGESRLVSCFIRGNQAPFPAKSKQGTLLVSNKEVNWTPYWSLKRAPLTIEAVRGELVARPNRRGDPGPLGTSSVRESRFATVRCWCSSGQLELGVPAADAPLVTFCLEGLRRTPQSES